MLGKTQTSLRQSPEFQTRMKGVWLGCCGQWCQKRQTDQGGKDMTTSVIRWHWWDDHGYTAELFQCSDASALCICCVLSRANNFIAIWHSFDESVVEPLITNVVAMLTCWRHAVKVISTVWLIDRRILVIHSHCLNLTVFDWCTCVRDGWTDDNIFAIHVYMLSRVNCSCDRRTDGRKPDVRDVI